MLSTFTYSVVAIVNLFPFLASSQNPNSFYYPTASAAQSFRQGEELNVSWTTNFTDPYLDLFCSYINNRTFTLFPILASLPTSPSDHILYKKLRGPLLTFSSPYQLSNNTRFQTRR